jgi:hypothetical protein
LSDRYLFEIIIDLRISMRSKEQGVINRAAYLPDFFSHVFITCFFKILHDPKTVYTVLPTVRDFPFGCIYSSRAPARNNGADLEREDIPV